METMIAMVLAALMFLLIRFFSEVGGSRVFVRVGRYRGWNFLLSDTMGMRARNLVYLEVNHAHDS